MFAQWLFAYLVEARGFLYMLPFLAGATMAPLGACDHLCRRIGPRWGCRLTAMFGLVFVAVFVLAGARANSPYVVVGMLSLCFGFTQLTEGAYWFAATYAGGPHTATVTGVMNTGGNAAGFLAPVVGLMVERLGWMAPFASGSVFALAAAAIWLFIGVQESTKNRPQAGA